MAAEKRKREGGKAWPPWRRGEGTWPRGGLMLDENAPRDLFAAMMQDASPASKELSLATSVTDVVSDVSFFFLNKLKLDRFLCVILELYIEICIYIG